MKKPIAVAIAAVLGLSGALGLGVASASAHTPSISASCEGVVLHGSNYDSNKTNTWTATVAGVTTSGTFGASFTQTIPVAQSGATTAWSATIADADHTKAYTETESGNVGPCGTAPLPDPSWPAGSSTCDTYTLPALNSYEKYPLMADGVTRYTAGTHSLVGTVTVDAHTLASDTTHKQGDHVYTFTSFACPTTPPTPSLLPCVNTGSAQHESDDNPAIKGADGWQFTNGTDHKAVDLIFPVSGNLQGFTSLTYTDKNVVGNGIFFRFILDLSADGGSAYNSFSVTTNTVNQASVADVGSKAALLGKTVAQVAAAYPHNKIVAIAWQTGSAYAAGDGALLTGYSGACGNVSFVDGPKPPVTPPTTPQAPSGIATGDTPISPLLPAGLLLLVAGAVFAFRKQLAEL